ncbi:hypothetical protein MP638_000541 [Amoeboaphelidium occidentale]|nr:hypothetical protein MP638_000541 [Amoeboaphelidium occidentale]
MKHVLASFIFASLTYCIPTYEETAPYDKGAISDIVSGPQIESEPFIDMENSRYYGRLVTTDGPVHNKKSISHLEPVFEDKPSDESLTEEQMEWFLNTYFPDVYGENNENSQPKSADVEHDRKAGAKHMNKPRRDTKRRKLYAE